MWSCVDNQEVGLEAAILERVRNSCADNLAGLKLSAEAVAFTCVTGRLCGWVGERRVRVEAVG